MRLMLIISLATYFSFFMDEEVKAQNTWTLEQCIEYAISHNMDIKQSMNEKKILQIERNSLKNNFLPCLYGESSQKYGFGRSLNRDNVYDDTNINSTMFSLSIEVPIFDGFKTAASLAKNKYSLLAQESNIQFIENDISLRVTSNYFQILLNKEICRIAQEQIVLTEEQEKKTTFLIENGKSPKSDLFDIRAQLANDKLVATEAKNTLRLSYLDLLQIMELRDFEQFDVEAIEETLNLLDTMKIESTYYTALDCMPQIKYAYFSAESSKQSIKIAKSGYYPMVYLGGGINSGYYHQSGTTNESFNYQMRNNIQNSLYITVSIPLFDRFSTRNKIKTAKVEHNKAVLTYENEKMKLYKEIEQAHLDAISAFEKYKMTSDAVKANQEAHRYAQEKYASGKSSIYEYNEIKMKLGDALSQQSQAKYTYLLKCKILDFYSFFTLLGKPLN
ncbi:outer membrane protein [Parabacteroides sp. PFB2-10]|uniref:TolC family protein n=1 Tax=Parabacteroides sp. PFB2-10 TaxID=1742405 RepID=UPI0024741127|nr:TolC family protein [Parabacteroides sp. PFB2-10]MDH6313079.1 outer membrane protein [Parabacteroides sp. PFB2-10]MDL2245017.1 TolC family protein [Parabacteroides sp. OttesenSCG-928-J18]